MKRRININQDKISISKSIKTPAKESLLIICKLNQYK